MWNIKSDNLSLSEREALRVLRRRTGVAIKPADKGGAGVVWSAVLVKRDIKEPSTSTLTRLAEQIGEVAMGSKMRPNSACLFVEYVEHQLHDQ